MSWEAKSRKIYEGCKIQDALTRLSGSVGVGDIPFSESELYTLAKRFRGAIYGSPRKRERLKKYKAHLSKDYGVEVVEHISQKLEEINNQIAYEEK